MFDLRFNNPSSFILAGPSQSGKTTFTLNLLRCSELFQDPRCFLNIIFYYHHWQSSYDALKSENIVKKWVEKMPTTDDITDETFAYKDGGSIILIDDYAQQINKNTVELFTEKCHHSNAVIILLTQNIFDKNPVFRTISLQSNYVLLFKNPRDSSQINSFAKQFSPGNPAWVIEAFKEATRNPYSYLLFDNCQTTPDKIRVRSNVLPHEFPMRVYMPKSYNM
ncbi:MAG TPA: hypothetical protein VIY47_14140 [Ignavibacteriaceae bacterium]